MPRLATLLALLLIALPQAPLRAQSTLAELPSTKSTAPAVDTQGEWYAVGHCMGQDALPTYQQFGLKTADISPRLAEVLASLGVQPSTLKASQFQLLQQGWDDATSGRAAAYTYPPDQPKSLVPVSLRGYHKFKAAPGTSPAGTPAAPGATLADKAAVWKKAVVKVIEIGKDNKVRGHGSGCFIGPGLVLTNDHVVRSATSVAIQLEADATFHPAVVIAHQKIPDIALLRVDLSDHEILPIGSSSECRELEEVIMIGYPLHIERSATYVKGAISALNRTSNGCEVLQLDIRANPGNSGGPVINTDGRIVGVLTSGDDFVEFTQFIYAQKTDFIRPFLEKYARGQYEVQE